MARRHPAWFRARQAARPRMSDVRRRPGREALGCCSGTGADLPPGRTNARPWPPPAVHRACTGVYRDRSAEACAAAINQWARLWFLAGEPCANSSKGGAPPSANCWCDVTPSRCCPGLAANDRRGRCPWNRGSGAGPGGTAGPQKVAATLQALAEVLAGWDQAAVPPDTLSTRQWAIPSRVIWPYWRRCATAGGEARPPHSPPPRRPAGLQDSGRARPALESEPARRAGPSALRIGQPGCSLRRRRNCACRPGEAASPRAAGRASAMPALLQLRLRPQPGRASGNLRAQRRPALRHPQSPSGLAARPWRLRTGRRSGEQAHGDPRLGGRSWPGAEFYQQALFHFPGPGRDGAYRAQWPPSFLLGERSCSLRGLVRGASPACDRWMRRFGVQAQTPGGWMHNRCRMIVALLLGQGS